MQTRNQTKLTEEEIERQLQNLSESEKKELNRIKEEWEGVQREANKTIFQHLREYHWAGEEREAMIFCRNRLLLSSAAGGFGFSFLADKWTTRVAGTICARNWQN